MGVYFEKLRNILHSLYLFSGAKKGFYGEHRSQLYFATFAIAIKTSVLSGWFGLVWCEIFACH